MKDLFLAPRCFRAWNALGCLLTLIAGFGCTYQNADADHPRLETNKTYAVIVGVLEWKNSSYTSFSKQNRRDQGLYDALRGAGVPENQMKLLLGKDATEENMRKALKEISTRAVENSTLIFYYAGHGTLGTNGVYFANYDAGSGNQGFLIDQITEIVKDNFRGQRVILLADCCYSGGLSDVAQDLSKHGYQTASLTSASIANTSTGNWTYTCNIIDAICGRDLLDTDNDGFVSLGEATVNVKNAMEMIERQRCGSSNWGLDPSFRLCKVPPSPKQTQPIPRPFDLQQFVRIKDGRRRRIARIIDFEKEKFGLEIQQYHDRRVVWKGTKEIQTLERPRLRITPNSSKDFPASLSPAASLKKAKANGKYTGLLRTIPAKFDYLSYSAFNDYGFSRESSYAGQDDIPEGYWVYVYPNWYVFKSAKPEDKEESE